MERALGGRYIDVLIDDAYVWEIQRLPEPGPDLIPIPNCSLDICSRYL
jgi:hypothetical protein